MSTENICNPAKNNKLRNQETFAIFMLTGLLICLLLVCPTLPRPSDCWELSHLHPKRTRSHSPAATALVLMTKIFLLFRRGGKAGGHTAEHLSPAGQAALWPSPWPQHAPHSRGCPETSPQLQLLSPTGNQMLEVRTVYFPHVEEVIKPWCIPGKL